MADQSLPIRRSAALIISDGTYLILQQRSDKDGIIWPNKIGLWGGAMEVEDEGDYELTALRELREETGLQPNDVTLTAFGSLSYEHMTVERQAVQQEVKLFVAQVKPDLTIHVYEGANVHRIPITKKVADIDMTNFAPRVSEALEQLEAYTAYHA